MSCHHTTGWKALLCASLLAASASTAAADAPEDYARQALLQTEGDATWYRLDLPMSVYWGAAHADLRDLRVFNAAGEALPYALTAVQGQHTETRREARTRFFPLYGARGGDGGNTYNTDDMAMRVRRDASGLLVEVLSDPAAQKTGAGALPLRGWLLDASAALDFSPERLRLDWENGAEGFQQLRIEASDDLQHWRAWGTGQIARLQFDGERIERNEVRLPGGGDKARYLRLTWLTPETAPTLTAATLTSVQATDQAALLWSEAMPGQRADSADKNASNPNAVDFVWQLPTRLPLQRVHVAITEPNTLAPVIVSGAWQSAQTTTPRATINDVRIGLKHHRPNHPPRDIWQPLARALLYRLPAPGGGQDVQEEIDLPGTAVNQLRLQIDSRGGGLGQPTPPQLRVAISGHQLIFLARGAPPYRLAFGREQAQSAALPLATLAPAYDASHPEKVKFGTARLADAAASAQSVLTTTTAAAATAARNKTYILWAALLAGVGLLIGMALSLLRGDKKPEGETR
ncbi:MAG: DUF3999 domain-containing protein [Burkholderiaceae bacterium]|jgi:hypothetical protein|nr:DUF3999 domain-containing protein [Burkholderiaceae bacterium]